MQPYQLEPDIKPQILPPLMHSVEPKPPPIMPPNDSHVSNPPTKQTGDLVALKPPSWQPDDSNESKAPTMLPDGVPEPKPPSRPPDYSHVSNLPTKLQSYLMMVLSPSLRCSKCSCRPSVATNRKVLHTEDCVLFETPNISKQRNGHKWRLAKPTFQFFVTIFVYIS